ncbi:MAG TPA: PIN domain-containing protein [Thermoanaerobaculia bacterium]|nr:PIN domain-containing protein [Thermoanaerobaculia bacterium]
MRRVVVDANVLVSFFVKRNAQQSDAAEELLQQAEEGWIIAIVPQFVVFETTYVLQSHYEITGERLAGVIQAVVMFPGVLVIDDCPWKRVFDLWPGPLASLADAAILATAMTNRYDAIATFDQKLTKRARELGVAAYW